MIDVSIIMPMRNAADYVEQAIASILADRETSLELIVVDDGSTDASARVVRSIGDPRIRLVAGPGRGVAAALNAGFAQARGHIVMRCDADDLYPPDRIARQMNWLRTNGDFGAVCGALAMMHKSGEVIAAPPNGGPTEITGELRTGSARTSYCTFAVRTAVLRQLGGCRSYFDTAEDLDLQFRLGSACRVWYDPAPTYYYRLHDDSITHRQSTARREFYERQAIALARQRFETGSDALERGVVAEPPPDDGRSSSAAEQIQGLLVGHAWRAFNGGDHRLGLALCWRACRVRPWSLTPWRSLAVMLVRLVHQPSARR